MKDFVILEEEFSNYNMQDGFTGMDALGIHETEDIKLLIKFNYGKHVKAAIKQNIFPEYIKDDISYEFPTYAELMNSIDTISSIKSKGNDTDVPNQSQNENDESNESNNANDTSTSNTSNDIIDEGAQNPIPDEDYETSDVVVSTKNPDYKEALDITEIIENIEDEPTWQVEYFGSTEDFTNFYSSLKLPNIITKIYDTHKQDGNLNESSEVELCFNKCSEIFTLYQDNNEKYIITNEQQSDKVTEFISQGIFKNGDSLVLISILKVSDNHSSLSDKYTIFCRQVINSDGTVEYTEQSLDTILLEDKDFETIMICSEFTLVLYPKTNELLYVKDSKAISPRTKVEDILKIIEVLQITKQ